MSDARTVKSYLEIIEANWGGYSFHRRCSTKEEFVYQLKALKKRTTLNLIYLAAHGTPSTLHLADKHKISFDQLEGEMKDGFQERILHIGACRFLSSRSKSRYNSFMTETGVVAISGFSKNIRWVESAALEMLWFNHLQDSKLLSSTITSFFNHYPDLCTKTGFQIFKR